MCSLLLSDVESYYASTFITLEWKRLNYLFPDGKAIWMRPDEVETFMSELETWCRADRGRQRRLAVTLGVSEQLVSNWIAGRRTPTLKHWLKLQELPIKGTPTILGKLKPSQKKKKG